MLRKIRMVLAVACLMMLTLLFLDFTGTVHAWFGWIARVQLLPAILAVNVSVLILLAITTLLYGRVYCSVICPLGVFQDVVSWFSGRRKKKKFRFSYSEAKSWIRYPVMVLFLAALVFGFSGVVNLLEPYSLFGRIASNLFAPVYLLANNLLAYFAEKVNSYAFYSVNLWIKSGAVLAVAAVSLIVVGLLSWRYGRSYCNSICPVGTFLGLLSRYSLFRIAIQPEKCTSCGLCEKGCKASCIDSKAHAVDLSRCVSCFSCLDKCRHSAITYAPRISAKKSAPDGGNTSANDTDTSRRKFLSILALFTVSTALSAQQKKVDGGLAIIEDKQVPNRKNPVTPPGSASARNFKNHCTACQLCVSVCPNHILKPSSNLSTLLQPEMTYERGYCRPECTKCSEVCPAGAILPVTVAEKSSIQLGHAVWVEKNCVVLTDGVECGNCARHCPAGAITMVEHKPKGISSSKIPVVNVERCIGCGACEYLCPARPFSAIYVEGHIMHRMV